MSRTMRSYESPKPPAGVYYPEGSAFQALGSESHAFNGEQTMPSGKKRTGNYWVIISSAVLAVFTVFVLLDTFAIERVQGQVLEADTTNIVAPSMVQGESDTSASTDGTAGGSVGTNSSGSASVDGSSNASEDDSVLISDHGSGRMSTTNSPSMSESTSTSANNSDSSTDSTNSASAAASESTSADTSTGTFTSTSPSTSESVSAGQQPVATENSYADENIQISISTTSVNNTDVYIADIQVSSVEYLKTALAQNAYGRNLKDTTSNMAQNAGAILAINGDYYGFRDDGYVIRNGVLYRDVATANTDALVIYGDGTMGSANQSSVSAQELLDAGAWQVLSFGPVLVENGQVAVAEGQEVSGKSMGSNPRTAIGMISPLHYIMVVSDGRTGEDVGLSLADLAQVMADAGATFAYNLDGGGSTTMWFNGQVINDPTSGNRSGERKVSDIVYFG